jgi:hypothetical protein
MRLPVPLMVGALLLSGGCQESSELGKQCTLIRKATAEELQQDPTIHRSIKERELPAPREGEARQDFISFGAATGCEDLICVRDAWYEPPAGVNPDAEAVGYCTRACVQGEASRCTVLPGTSNVVSGVRERMTCRPLLLDQQQLDQLRAEDPVAYRQTFGDNTSPYYCSGGPPSNSGG